MPLASPAQVTVSQAKGDLDDLLGMNSEKSSFDGLRMISRCEQLSNL